MFPSLFFTAKIRIIFCIIDTMMQIYVLFHFISLHLYLCHPLYSLTILLFYRHYKTRWHNRFPRMPDTYHKSIRAISQEYPTSITNFIFRLKTCIFSLKTYIFSLKMYIFNLKIYIFNLKTNLVPYFRHPCQATETALQADLNGFANCICHDKPT